MNRCVRTISKSLLFGLMGVAAALAPGGAAHAADGGGLTMEVLVDGLPLPEYAARGARYIEALKGRDYSVRLQNHSAQRVAVALSVDGLNSIDARTTTAREARKWVLGPYETITLDGWQTSASTARRFVFTSEAQSYGAWLGNTKNLGLIAAAVFRERPRAVVMQESGGSRDEARLQPGRSPDAGAPAPEAERKDAAPAEPGARSRPAPLGEFAATGIGEETSHPVRPIAFETEDAPAAVVELRYEYRDSLIRLGVLPDLGPCAGPLARRERARGFNGMEFAPDPYR